MDITRENILQTNAARKILRERQPEISTVDDHKKIGCFVKLWMGMEKQWVTGDSVDELKDRAVQIASRGYDAATWDDANLICFEEGCRVLDMVSLEKCTDEKKHKVFLLVGPNARSCDDLALDSERMADLYKELTRDSTKTADNIMEWTHSRRNELEGLYYTSTNRLALRVGKSAPEIEAFQENLSEYLMKTERSYYGRDADIKF